MVKKYIFTLMLFFLMFGCISSDGFDNSYKVKSYDVVVTFYPLYLIVKDIVNATYLVPPYVDPHHWDFSSKDIAVIENADLFLYVGFEAKGGVPLYEVLNTSPYSHMWLSPYYADLIARFVAERYNKFEKYEKFRICLNNTVGKIFNESKGRRIAYATTHPFLKEFSEYFGFEDYVVESVADVYKIKENGINVLFYTYGEEELANKISSVVDVKTVFVDVMGDGEESYCSFLYNLWKKIDNNVG